MQPESGIRQVRRPPCPACNKFQTGITFVHLMPTCSRDLRASFATAGPDRHSPADLLTRGARTIAARHLDPVATRHQVKVRRFEIREEKQVSSMCLRQLVRKSGRSTFSAFVGDSCTAAAFQTRDTFVSLSRLRAPLISAPSLDSGSEGFDSCRYRRPTRLQHRPGYVSAPLLARLESHVSAKPLEGHARL